MQTFPTAKIRNVALVGHGGTGKTSLAEALLFTAGATARLGRVEDGTTVCDFDEEETRRGISVSLSVAPFEYDGHKINLLDTPGYADFVTDVAAAFRVADLAIFVVSAVEGVEVQTEFAWRMADDARLPRIVFVNKLDRERASFDRTLAELQERFGAGIAPLELPIGVEADFRGVIDLLRDTAETYADGSPRGNEGPVPAELANEEHAVHDALIEGIVVADDALTERYLADDPIGVDELGDALARGIDDATVFPVLCGSATGLIGIDRLARFIVEEGPEPHVTGDGGATALIVFKTVVDAYVGRVNLFKVLQGVLHADDTLVNGRTMHEERLHQLTTMCGKAHEPATELHAGDLGAVAKLADTGTGDVLGVRGADVTVPSVDPPEPLFGIAIRAAAKNDEDKLATALHRIVDEDVSVRVDRDAETHQTVLRGMGETHLSIVQERLARSSASNSRPNPYASRTARPSRARPRLRAGSRSRAAAMDSLPSRRFGWNRWTGDAGWSSWTRSSAGRSPASTSRRSRKGSVRPPSTAASRGFPSSISGSRASTESTTASTVPRWRSRPPRRSASRRHWHKPGRSSSNP